MKIRPFAPSEPEATFAARNSKQLMDPGMIVNVIVDAVAPSVRAVWRTKSRDISTSGPVGLPVIEKLDPRPKRSILADVRMCFKMPVITVKRAIRRPDPFCCTRSPTAKPRFPGRFGRNLPRRPSLIVRRSPTNKPSGDVARDGAAHKGLLSTKIAGANT